MYTESAEATGPPRRRCRDDRGRIETGSPARVGGAEAIGGTHTDRLDRLGARVGRASWLVARLTRNHLQFSRIA